MSTRFFIVLKMVIPVLIFIGAGYKIFHLFQVDEPRTVAFEYVSSASSSTTEEIAVVSTTSPEIKGEVVVTVSVPETKIIKPTTVAKTEKTSTPAPLSVASPSASVVTAFEFSSSWRDSVVNLLCTNRYGDSTSAFSGSGILVDSRGVILTNAHVAIEFLFADWPVPSLNECSVRIGSPASPRYRAALLYIPDEFVSDEVASLYSPSDNRVYGKNDYALLVITGRIDPTTALPDVFPHLEINTESALAINTPVYLIGYPASFLGGITILRDLYLLSSPATVNIVRTIEGDSESGIIAFGGNVVGQHGSSGGGVIGPGGRLAGLITFFDKNFGYTTNERILNAITLGYVNRDIAQDTGVTLSEFLAQGNFLERSHYFMNNQGARYQRLYADAWKQAQGIIIPGVSY